MFCALHVVVAFGLLLVVCSLVRANAVCLRVQLRPSPVQIFRPGCRFLFFFSFLFVAKPRSFRQFFPARWNSLLPACVPCCSLCLPRLPWRSPRLVFPFLLFVSLLPNVANQNLRESFPCLRPARERVKFSAIHPSFPKIRELWFVLVSQVLGCFPISKYLLPSPISVACLSKRPDLFANFLVVESQIPFAVSLLLQAVVSAPPLFLFSCQHSLGKYLSASCVLPPLDFSFCALLLRLH